MSIDSRTVAYPHRDPVVWTGRFVGANANALTAFTGTSKKMTLTRNSAGNVTLQLSDPTPGTTGNGTIGLIQAYWAEVASPNNAKNVLVTPPAAGATALTMQVAWPNGTAVDVQSYEELIVEVWTTRNL